MTEYERMTKKQLIEKLESLEEKLEREALLKLSKKELIDFLQSENRQVMRLQKRLKELEKKEKA